MAKYLDDITTHDQRIGLVNPLFEGNSFLDDAIISHSLMDEVSEPPTFCVRCRSLSNSYDVMNCENDRTCHECNGHGPLLNLKNHSVFHRQHSINLGDGADMPLLDSTDELCDMPSLAGEESDHCHTSVPKTHSAGAWKQLLAAAIMCLMFMVAEIVGGYLAGSLAVMTDAAHLLSDFVGFMVSLFSIWVGQWPPTKKLSFGYYRAEVLGALGSVSLIWMMTGIFVFMAVQRVISEDFTIEADTMMVVSGIGVAFNIIMGLVLHGACKAVRHAHVHSHVHTHPHTKQQRNINVRAAIVHVLGDLIQSVGVLVSAIVIKFYPQAKMVDPICTFLFSAVVLATTVTIVRETTHVLMEGFPRQLDYSSIVSRLREIDGVRSVHSLHVWSLTVNKNALAVHLAIDQGVEPEVVLRQAQKLVRWKLDIHTTTIQVERYCPDTMRDCLACQAPSD